DNARPKATVSFTGVAATDRATVNNSTNWEVNDLTAFVLPNPGITLPVSLEEFNGDVNSGNVDLSWKAANEDNLQGYGIERSTDGMKWQQITFITAPGAAAYSWTDRGPVTGQSYYRLACTGMDGEIKYSSVLRFTGNTADWEIQVTPNPVIAGAI